MDAVKFVKEYLRMCTMVDECEDFCTVPAKERSQESAEEIVESVEQGSAAHPRKTRQSVFLEQWPQARLDDNGCVHVCPGDVSATHRDADRGCAKIGILCPNCRREFWMQEIE